MARLRLFGTPSLDRDDGGTMTGRPAHRHRLALLTLLSLAPSHRLSRDKLIAWIWPETDADRGRNLLNVSTYILRAALGDGALVSEGDHLRLDSVLVSSDVSEFEAAVGSGDHLRAVALYAGPFLDGYFVPQASEFEQWTERERQRLAALYGRSLEAVAEQAEEDGDLGGAVERWQARAAHDPWDSRVALRLMQAFEASGNRAAALHHAAAHERRLEAEFGTGSPEVSAVAERLRRDAAAAAFTRLGCSAVNQFANIPLAEYPCINMRPSVSTPRPASSARALSIIAMSCRSIRSRSLRSVVKTSRSSAWV